MIDGGEKGCCLRLTEGRLDAGCCVIIKKALGETPHIFIALVTDSLLICCPFDLPLLPDQLVVRMD